MVQNDGRSIDELGAEHDLGAEHSQSSGMFYLLQRETSA